MPLLFCVWEELWEFEATGDEGVWWFLHVMVRSSHNKKHFIVCVFFTLHLGFTAGNTTELLFCPPNSPDLHQAASHFSHSNFFSSVDHSDLQAHGKSTEFIVAAALKFSTTSFSVILSLKCATSVISPIITNSYETHWQPLILITDYLPDLSWNIFYFFQVPVSLSLSAVNCNLDYLSHSRFCLCLSAPVNVHRHAEFLHTFYFTGSGLDYTNHADFILHPSSWPCHMCPEYKSGHSVSGLQQRRAQAAKVHLSCLNLFFTCGCHFLCVMSSWELSPLCLGLNNSHHEWEREWREGWASRKLSLPWNFWCVTLHKALCFPFIKATYWKDSTGHPSAFVPQLVESGN